MRLFAALVGMTAFYYAGREAADGPDKANTGGPPLRSER
jgi:hypothetical protein